MNLPFTIDLKGKTAVVTGGGGVLCSGFSKALAACGANVAVLDLDLEAAERVAAEIRQDGGAAAGLKADVLDPASLQDAHDLVMQIFGPCDILVNGAGGNNPKGTTSKEYLFKEDLQVKEDVKTFFDLDPKGIAFVFNLNYLGTLLPTQVFAKDMVGRPGAAIINISSMNAIRPLTRIPAYSGAKAAVSNLTQWLAVHFSKVGIRVNAIAPGYFATEMNKALTDNAEFVAWVNMRTPMKRWGDPDELAGIAVFLASDAASFVTGQTIYVDGGMSVNL